MAPFNNYCIVCDKLIVPIPNYNKFNKLYCSDSCQHHDRSILKFNSRLENSTGSNNLCVLSTDPIITSPLLLPLLKETTGSNSDSGETKNSIFDHNLTTQNNNIFNNDLMISNFSDHMAENNYKIWLNKM